MVKYACKVTRGGCLSQSFTAVHEDIPKCMPEEHLLLEPVKLDIRGFESRRALQNVSPVDWFCPSGRKKNGTHKPSLIVCENVFILTFVIIRQSEKCFGTSRRAMQKQALPENGYRVIPNSAKRFLSALCRRHSNFQPLLLHE